jgi:hypothetical protein
MFLSPREREGNLGAQGLKTGTAESVLKSG